METLTGYFISQGFTDTEARTIAGTFVPRSLKRGELFVEEGKTARHMAFVETGFLQYYINLDGEEKTTYTAGPHSFVASLVSFLRQVPARENIRAIMDTTLWLLEFNRLKELQQGIPSFNAFYVGILEWQICCIDESRLDALVLTARERYEKMMAKEPALIQQIPLQYLASILGVTPRHLSRIRKNIR
jgi:CRP/FNR family transcriptional regulator, anaerobic regulatory protein